MSWLTPALMFKAAAALHAISAPGHILLGFDAVYPALNKIPKLGKDAVGHRGAQNCWNYVAASLVIASLLNWQWSRTGGPQTQEEIAIFWTLTGMHAINGLRYLQVGAKEALLPMWVAPALSTIAWYRSAQ